MIDTKDTSTEQESELTIVGRIGKWNITKNNLNWVFGLSGLALIILFIFSCVYESKNWIGNFIGTVGGLASGFGIYLTLCELIETKKDVEYVTGIAVATKNATEETKKSLRKTMSVAQVAKFCEQIKRIQEHFDNKEHNIVILLTHELQEAVIELRKYLKSLNIEFDEEALTNHITKMGMNITFIRTAIERNNEKYKRDDIRKDFQDLLKIMLELKAQLTIHENEGSQNTV